MTYVAQYDIFTVGAGYLDTWAALNNSDVVQYNETSLSPTVTYEPVTGNVNLLLGTSVVWGDSLIWGTALVWGNSVFVSGTSVVRGDSVVWGNITNVGFSVVWGNSVVWGDTAVGGEASKILIYGEN